MLSSATSEYIRVSCAYAVMNGSAAQTMPVKMPTRGPNRLQPAHSPAGMQSVEKISDSACVACSPVPNACTQKCRSM